MRKSKKIISIIFCIFILISNIFAAAVSDNDGAAFITKAEFESLKNEFQGRLNSYNTGLDDKISAAVASYISGITVGKVTKISTAFVLDGDENKIVFVGKTNDFNHMNNELYTYDKIFEIFNGTYAKTAYYVQDTYDTFAFQAYYTKGNKNNYLFVINDDKLVKSTKKDAQMNAARVYMVYTTYHAQSGMHWRSITQTLDNPDQITNSTSAYVNYTDAQGIGVHRQAGSTSTIYTNLSNVFCFAGNGGNFGTNADGTFKGQQIRYTNVETKTLSAITNTCDVSISGTDVGTNLHWPTGSNYNIKTIDKEWGSAALIDKYNTSRVAYTYEYKLRNAGGTGVMEFFRVFTPSVSGYGLKWKFTSKSLGNVYYENIATDWNELLSYSGGLPLCQKSSGTFDITLTLSGSAKIAFSNSQNTTFPTGTSRLVPFKVKTHSSTGSYTNYNSTTLNAGTYDFQIDLNNAALFLTVDMSSRDDTVTITQVGDANLTEKG